ncbi:MAG: VWA domain-containing protein [Bifidobacteriaceae bacterium]|jgi:uncharacterized protein YegL|nr:VWA domain-containing protein [Bifidobacteriaceae bacterium]
MAEPEGRVLPIYLVADVSASMQDHFPTLHSGLQTLREKMEESPAAAAAVRFSMILFGSRVETLMRIADFNEISSVPSFQNLGGTNYTIAFQELARQIPLDVDLLKAENYRVLRPAVFFLTDGYPNEGGDWTRARDQLMSPANKRRPNIMAFGVGEADAATVSAVASRPQYAFISMAGADMGGALSEFMAALQRSVVSSGVNVSAGGGLIVADPKGFTRIEAEEID